MGWVGGVVWVWGCEERGDGLARGGGRKRQMTSNQAPARQAYVTTVAESTRVLTCVSPGKLMYIAP